MATAGRLIIVCGLPGAGKTTLARRLAAETGATRFCPDEWMDAFSLDPFDEPRRAAIETLQWQLAQDILALGGTAIIEWGTWGRSERDTLRNGARALGARVELHYLDLPLPELHDRIRTRNYESPPITFEQLQAWSQSFQHPTAEELAFYDPPLEAPVP